MKESLVFQPQGTCSRRIDIRLDGDTIREVVFTGGCHGNTQGIAALVRRRSPVWRGSIAGERGLRVPTSWPGR